MVVAVAGGTVKPCRARAWTSKDQKAAALKCHQLIYPQNQAPELNMTGKTLEVAGERRLRVHPRRLERRVVVAERPRQGLEVRHLFASSVRAKRNAASAVAPKKRIRWNSAFLFSSPFSYPLFPKHTQKTLT